MDARLTAAVALAALLPTTSLAGTLDSAVLQVLQSPSGWKHDRTLDDGLVVSTKAAAGTVAYRGELPLADNVDPDLLWKKINDIEGHPKVAGKLAEATIFLREGNTLEYFQVMHAPTLMPGSQRYWFAHTELENTVASNPDHRRRCWSGLPPGDAAEQRKGVQSRHPRAIEVAMTHGCWELQTRGAKVWLVYTTVSDPGGSVPAAVARSLVSHTLPENMRAFTRVARR